MDYFETGFSVREPMWHGLGEILPEYPGRDAAIRAAGHDFTVEDRPLYLGQSDRLALGATPLEGWRALVANGGRFDGRILHVAKDSYTVIQNETLWDIADALVAQPDVKYETAGVLRDGAIVWVLARLDEEVRIGPDRSEVRPYVVVSSAHDGSAALQAGSTLVRVVCWNTWNAALLAGERENVQYTFRHTARVADRIEEAREVIRGVRNAVGAFAEMASELARVSVTPGQSERFIVEFIPAPPETLISDRVLANVEDARAQVRAILARQEGEGLGGNAYGLLQAGVEYLDHVRGYRSRDTLFGRTLLRPEPLKRKLLPLVRAVAE